MLKTLNLKKGFTFIEILIVMTIIAILTVLSVAGYTAFRKAALIDLGADSLIAQISDMKDKAIHGTKFGVEEGGSTDFLKCYGFSVVKNNDVYEMTAAIYKFTGKKVWSDLEGKWIYQGCGEKLDDGILEMDKMIKVEAVNFIQKGSSTSEDLDNFVFRFVPPNGDLEISKNNNPFGNEKGLIEMKIRYGSGDDDRYARFVEINLEKGNAVKKVQ